MSQKARRVVIMGAAGRDFHNFNLFFRDNPDYQVLAFTAFQIPDIDGRTYPKELAGKLYPAGIPIHAESELPELIAKHRVEEVVFAYSDVAYNDLMHKAAMVNALGPDFTLMGAANTMLKSKKPVIAVCATRTGCGKSQTSRAITRILKKLGKKAVVIRHPMPYGDLNAQRCQRYETLADMDLHKCTIEEREEYEAHLRIGNILYAGVDYGDILAAAEKEADIILWDGGNNDIPFYKPDLHITVADPHRAGHELRYYPGETNLRMASLVVIGKTGTAKAEQIEEVRQNIKAVNPGARIMLADSVVTASDPAAIKGKRVLVVEDGPTLTHGEMLYGAGIVAAKQCGAAEIVDPHPYAVGSIKATYEKYRHLQSVLPAMGYGAQQIADLKATIDAVPCDVVVVGTPVDLASIIKGCSHPMVGVSYELDEKGCSELETVLKQFVAQMK